MRVTTRNVYLGGNIAGRSRRPTGRSSSGGRARCGQRSRRRTSPARAKLLADLEAPIADGLDVRLTMRDAIIVRKRVKVRRRLGVNYKATLEVPTAIGTLESRRGWVVGGDPDKRTPSGLWPSDHGGAVMALRLR